MVLYILDFTIEVSLLFDARMRDLPVCIAYCGSLSLTVSCLFVLWASRMVSLASHFDRVSNSMEFMLKLQHTPLILHGTCNDRIYCSWFAAYLVDWLKVITE